MAPSAPRTVRPAMRRPRALAALVVLGLVAGACGTQRSEDDIASAAGAAERAGAAAAGQDAVPTGDQTPAAAGEDGLDVGTEGEPAAAATATSAAENPAGQAAPAGRTPAATPSRSGKPAPARVRAS